MKHCIKQIKRIAARAPPRAQWSLFFILANTLIYSLHDPLDTPIYRPTVPPPTIVTNYKL